MKTQAIMPKYPYGYWKVRLLISKREVRLDNLFFGPSFVPVSRFNHIPKAKCQVILASQCLDPMSHHMTGCSVRSEKFEMIFSSQRFFQKLGPFARTCNPSKWEADI